MRIFFAYLALTLISTLNSAWAHDNVACPDIDPKKNIFESKVYKNGIIAFEKSADINNPIDLNLYLRNADNLCSKNKIDSYSVEGSEPTILSVFFYRIKNELNIVVLVSWELNNRGVGTYGTLYQIYGYAGKNSTLQSNPIIEKSNSMSGIDGYSDGEPSSFSGKDALHAKRLIDKLK